MLGYCMHCKTLRAIVRLPNRMRDGQIAYGPIEHAEPDRHRGCGGVAFGLDHHEDDRTDIGVTHACELCEQGLFEADVDKGAASCPGGGKAIR